MTPGVTGYIGGQVLHDLLALNQYDVTALVRDDERAKTLNEKTAVKTAVANLDSPELPDIVSEFDIVMHLAHADHVQGAKSIIAGLEKRAETADRKPILIHTSGTGVLINKKEVDGRFKSKEIFSDDDLSTYHKLPGDNPHKDVDDIVLEAGRRGIIDAIIVAPPTIWGTGEGEFNQHSIQVPLYIKVAIEAGEGLIVNDGANTWSIINVKDLSEGYLTILRAAIDGNIPANPDERYFFCENEEYAQRQVAETATKILYDKGKVKSPTPRNIKPEEAKEYGEGRRNIVNFTGSNSRSRAVLLRKLGWKPTRGGRKEFLESIQDEVEYALREDPKYRF